LNKRRSNTYNIPVPTYITSAHIGSEKSFHSLPGISKVTSKALFYYFNHKNINSKILTLSMNNQITSSTNVENDNMNTNTNVNTNTINEQPSDIGNDGSFKKHKPNPTDESTEKECGDNNGRVGSTSNKSKFLGKNYRNTNRKMDEQPHAGSFANPAMRELFHVHLSPSSNTTPNSSAAVTSPTTIHENNNDNDNDNKNESKNNTQQTIQQVESKAPKRKVALLIGFLGTNYSGMQINYNQNTLHAQIELALYKANLITHSNFGFPQKQSWSSSARTDKGVHSAAQVCSVKILMVVDDYDHIREMINHRLPPDIRILDIKKVSKGFCAKTARDKVRYQYMLPSFLLQDCNTLHSLCRSAFLDGEIQTMDIEHSILMKIRNDVLPYRATESSIQKLRDILQKFVGTHSFHNYTNGKSATDASANRYIISFTAEEPVVDQFGMEWIPFLVVGQSFLLHQIRKMMSMTIDVARGVDTLECLENSFTDQSLQVNVAPAQGLFLEMSYYEAYSRRISTSDQLVWHSTTDNHEETPAQCRWKEFKEQVLMKHIMKEEAEQCNFVKYVIQQDFYFRKNFRDNKRNL
jgi:tRNA pseudouridine(38-40) synthase